MSKELFNLTSLYLKLASSGPKISVVENKDPVLKELSEIKDFDDSVEFAKKQDWELLGEGSARIVFQIDEKRIIKVALDDKGLAQNLTESYPEMQGPYTIPVLIFDPRGKWIIEAWTSNISKVDFKKYIGVGFDAFMSALDFAMNNNSDDWKDPKEYDEIKRLPLFKYLVDVVVNGKLLIGDISKESSFGLLDGKKIVLRYLGLSKKNFHDYYSDDDSSSKSSHTTT